MNELGLTAWLGLSAFLFACGFACLATRRNAVGMLMGVELMLNAANVNFVAASRYRPELRIEGQIFALVVIVLAAAEAAVALAIILQFYARARSVDPDAGRKLSG